jgi:hypothetical protein
MWFFHLVMSNFPFVTLFVLEALSARTRRCPMLRAALIWVTMLDGLLAF